MKLAEIQEMPLEELKSDFMSIMTEVVISYGDDKEDARESTESSDKSLRD